MEWTSQFESVGRCMPVAKLSTEDLLQKVHVQGLGEFASRTGIEERRVCSPGEDSLTLAVDAVKDCLSYSKYNADDLDMIIYCSISKFNGGLSHQYEPTMSICIKDEINARTAITFDISNACAGMLTGVYLAENYIKLGIVKNCMVVSGEYITHAAMNAAKAIRSAMSQQLASLTVGDSGAAVLLDRSPLDQQGLAISGFTTLSKYSRLCIGRQGRKFAGGYMKTKAKKIHRASISGAIPVVEHALNYSDITYGQVDYLIPHQTSKGSMIAGGKQYAKYFGNEPGEMLINLKDCGNTSSTSHFVALYRFLHENKFKKGDRIMLVCLASGINLGTVIFTIDEIVDRYGNNH